MKITVSNILGTETVTAIEYRDIYRGPDAGLNELAMNVKLYPNPTSGFINLEFATLTNKRAQIDLLGTDGKLLKSVRFKQTVSNFRLDLSDVKPGIYFIQLSLGDAVETEKIEALISGSGKLNLSGVANNGKFNISGSGKIDAYDLELKSCNAKISGSGDMWVNAEENLSANISGSGSVFYYGNPEVESRISGSGKLIHEN
mgnify:CR=1 FL=1